MAKETFRLSPEDREALRKQMEEEALAKKARADAERGMRATAKKENMKVVRDPEEKPKVSKPKPTNQNKSEPMAKKTASPSDELEEFKDERYNIGELSDEIHNEDSNPISGDTVDRPYARQQIDATAGEPVYEVPSMDFTPPPPPPTGDAPQPAPSQPAGNIPPQAPNGQNLSNEIPNNDQGNFNEGYSQLDDKEKRIGSEMLVDSILDGYEKLHDVGNYLIQVKEEKLMEMSSQGKIDLGFKIPLGNDEGITVKEFVDNYNIQASQALKLDPNFRKDVRGPMVREFMKRNIGMTDMQYIAVKFGMDIVAKVGIVVNMRNTINNALESISKLHMESKSVNTQATAQNTQPAADSVNYERNADGSLKDNTVHEPVVVVE